MCAISDERSRAISHPGNDIRPRVHSIRRIISHAYNTKILISFQKCYERSTHRASHSLCSSSSLCCRPRTQHRTFCFIGASGLPGHDATTLTDRPAYDSILNAAPIIGFTGKIRYPPHLLPFGMARIALERWSGRIVAPRTTLPAAVSADSVHHLAESERRRAYVAFAVDTPTRLF